MPDIGYPIDGKNVLRKGKEQAKRILPGLTCICFIRTYTCMARTTLILDDTQLERLRDLARAQRRTMTDLINEFIAEGLAARTTAKSSRELRLPLFNMGPPRVNVADREALEAIMVGAKTGITHKFWPLSSIPTSCFMQQTALLLSTAVAVRF
jgi:hypothetical protein